MKMISIPECPDEGQGVNNWTIRVAHKLRRDGYNASEANEIIHERTSRSDNFVAEAEISRAIETVYKKRSRPNAANMKPKWPQTSSNTINEILAKPMSLEEFNASSPSDLAVDTREALDILFPGNPLLCLGSRNDRVMTRLKSDWNKDVFRKQLIVPNTMSAKEGMTQTGRLSSRCLDNTGPRRFLVMEQDPPRWKDLEESAKEINVSEEAYQATQLANQGTILYHLNQFMPLACAVFSGNRSLHGWFYVEDVPEAERIRFFRYCIQLGADPAMWTKCQLTRLPGGYRTPGSQHQKIHYLNINYAEYAHNRY